MKKIHFRSRQAPLALALGLALALPLSAQAGSFKLPTTTAAGWARAGAGGSLWANDASAAYNDPAEMAFFSHSTLQLTGSGIRPSAKFSGEFRDVNGNPVSGGNPNGFGKFIPFPNFGLVVPVNDRLSLGAAVTVPYGLVSDYSPDWQGRYFGTKTSVQSIAISLSAGFKVTDTLALGIGILGQHTKAQLNTMIDTTGAADALFGLPLPPQAADEQLNVTLKKQFAFGYFASLAWKPTSQDTLGVTYHSQVNNDLSGHYRVYGGAQGKQLLALAPTLNPTLPAINPDGGTASSHLDTPAFASVDWVHDFDNGFSLGATVKWIDWSHFSQLLLKSNGQTLVGLPENYSNGWVYSLGGDYRINSTWTLHGGLGYDKTPTSITSRDPRIPDGSRKLLGMGISYNASRHLSFDLGYQHQFVGDTRVHLQNPPILGGGTMDGHFNDHGDVVSVTGTYQF